MIRGMQILLLIGTRKGGFIAASDGRRRDWTLSGPILKGCEVNHLTYLPGARTMIVAGKSGWFGPAIQTSTDLGRTWRDAPSAIRFEEGRGHSVERIWTIKADPREPGRLYAGVDPGALFVSRDAGEHWSEVSALTEHPTRTKWVPGAGGLMVHSMAFDPAKRSRVMVGVSAAGAFRTDDDGATWIPKNTGVRADFLPDKFPEVGQCVHHLEGHPTDGNILYQQNHCGVYRSDDAGDHWVDISAGLPSRFGFPLAVLPNDGDTIFVIPEESDQFRMTPEGSLRVFRSRDRGSSWEPLTTGLPQTHAYANVMRMAMAADTLDPAGVYVGTQGGQLLASRDAGDHWEVIFNWLPPIYSVEAAAIS
jgi:photosystem II stability/assembly factor-like uncharacterized protein